VAPRIPRPLFQRILAGRDLAAGTCAIYERLISEYQPVHRCKMPTLDAIPLIPPAQG